MKDSHTKVLGANNKMQPYEFIGFPLFNLWVSDALRGDFMCGIVYINPIEFGGKSVFDDKKQYLNGEYFYQIELSNHYVDYIPRDSDTLFVTFEGMKPKSLGVHPWQRLPWACEFLKTLNVDQIGVKIKKIDWYRCEEIQNFFLSDDFISMAQGYKKVFFYGTSMGGFAALVFSSVVKDSSVLALSPQSTLDVEKVPWETRYESGLRQDWSGRFSDAADCLERQGKIYVVYDPFLKPDAMHLARLPSDKITRIKVPFMGHDIGKGLRRLKILKGLVLHCVDGDLEDWFPKAIRVRKDDDIYLSNANFWCAYRLGWQQRFEESIPYVKRALELDIKNEHALKMAKRLQEILG